MRVPTKTAMTRKHLLRMKGSTNKNLSAFLDCYHDLSYDSQMDIAAMLDAMGLSPSCGELLFRLIQLGHI